MSHLLPDSRTVTTSGFDPKYFDVLPEARRQLSQTKSRYAELKTAFEERINKPEERNSNIIQAEINIQAEITQLEEEINTLTERIAQVEHEEEYEFWCGVGAVIEMQFGDVKVRGKVEGMTDMCVWIRTSRMSVVVEKRFCKGVYYANKQEALEYPVECYSPMSDAQQEELRDPLPHDEKNKDVVEPWCQVGAVVKYQVPGTSMTVYGKVEGRTEKNLWVKIEDGSRVRMKKSNWLPHLTKWESEDEGFPGPFQMMKPKDCIDPEIDSDDELEN